MAAAELSGAGRRPPGERGESPVDQRAKASPAGPILPVPVDDRLAPARPRTAQSPAAQASDLDRPRQTHPTGPATDARLVIPAPAARDSAVNKPVLAAESTERSLTIEPGLVNAWEKSQAGIKDQVKTYHAPDGKAREEDVWVDFYNSDITDYERTFASVLQQYRDAHLSADESAEAHDQSIADLIQGTQGAVVVDLLAPSGTLASAFKKLPDDPDRIGISVSNTDQRGEKELERDERLGIQQVVGDITTRRTLRDLETKFDGRRVNVFLERGMGALADLPAHPQYFRYMGQWMWNNLSSDNGIMLLQLPQDRFFERRGVPAPNWTEILDYNGVEYYSQTGKNSKTLLVIKNSDKPLEMPESEKPASETKAPLSPTEKAREFGFTTEDITEEINTVSDRLKHTFTDEPALVVLNEANRAKLEEQIEKGEITSPAEHAQHAWWDGKNKIIFMEEAYAETKFAKIHEVVHSAIDEIVPGLARVEFSVSEEKLRQVFDGQIEFRDIVEELLVERLIDEGVAMWLQFDAHPGDAEEEARQLGAKLREERRAIGKDGPEKDNRSYDEKFAVLTEALEAANGLVNILEIVDEQTNAQNLEKVLKAFSGQEKYTVGTLFVANIAKQLRSEGVQDDELADWIKGLLRNHPRHLDEFRNPEAYLEQLKEKLSTDSPTTVVYRGVRETAADEAEQTCWKAFSRGFTEFQLNIQSSFPEMEKLDTMLHDQVERAIAAGREVVTVVDLGAGYGNFTKQFLAELGVGEKTRALLDSTDAPIRLQFNSVTDSETQEEHLQETEFVGTESPYNTKIDAKEIRYSITSSQTVKQLFENLGIDSTDLVIASNFMSYLYPQVFEGVTSDVVDSLNPGGQFLAHGYATFVGDKLSRDDVEIPQEPVWLKKNSDREGPGVSTQAMIERCQKLLLDTDIPRQEIVAAVQEMFGELLDTQAFSEQDKARMRMYRDELLPGDPRGVLEDVLIRVKDKEQKIRLATIRRDKNAILDRLQETHGGAAEVRYRDHGIHIEKHVGEIVEEEHPVFEPGRKGPWEHGKLHRNPDAPLRHFEAVGTNESGQPIDRFGNAIIASPTEAYFDRNGNPTKAATLVSNEGETFINAHTGILEEIENGIEKITELREAGLPWSAIGKIDFGNGRSLSLLSMEKTGNQSITYILEVGSEKYIIQKHQQNGIFKDATQPYINEMLQTQEMREDLTAVFESARLETQTFLFATGQLSCVKFEEGEHPTNDELIARMTGAASKIMRYIIDKRESGGLWNNILGDLKPANFIKRADGTLVLIDPFVYKNTEEFGITE